MNYGPLLHVKLRTASLRWNRVGGGRKTSCENIMCFGKPGALASIERGIV